jgi:hypothetical protein
MQRANMTNSTNSPSLKSAFEVVNVAAGLSRLEVPAWIQQLKVRRRNA